jgi:hypothetical protein
MKRLFTGLIFTCATGGFLLCASSVQIPGHGPYIPDIPNVGLAPSYNSPLLIDTSTKKVALLGKVWFKERSGTKNISRVQFMLGAVTKAGGSGLTVSLQDIASATGPPLQPDETADQTVAIPNGDASFASNSWYRTGAFNASRTVNFNGPVAVVIEFDASGRLGSDSVVINALTVSATNFINTQGIAALKSGTWSAQSVGSILILEFDDGTFGSVSYLNTLPASAFNTHTFASNTGGADEYALAINLPFSCKIDGGWAFVGETVNSSDFDILLYSGTSALSSYTVDANMMSTNGARLLEFTFNGEVALAANTTYYLSFRPTTTNSIVLYSYDVSNANFFSATFAGTGLAYATRLDQGTWAATTNTRRLFAGVRISSITTGSETSGVF